MKMTKDDYQELAKRIEAKYEFFGSKLTQNIIRQYQANKRFKDYRVAFMWATFHNVKANMNLAYLNDSHIQTALKAIHKDLGLLYP